MSHQSTQIFANPAFEDRDREVKTAEDGEVMSNTQVQENAAIVRATLDAACDDVPRFRQQAETIRGARVTIGMKNARRDMPLVTFEDGAVDEDGKPIMKSMRHPDPGTIVASWMFEDGIPCIQVNLAACATARQAGLAAIQLAAKLINASEVSIPDTDAKSITKVFRVDKASYHATMQALGFERTDRNGSAYRLGSAPAFDIDSLVKAALAMTGLEWNAFKPVTMTTTVKDISSGGKTNQSYWTCATAVKSYIENGEKYGQQENGCNGVPLMRFQMAPDKVGAALDRQGWTCCDCGAALTRSPSKAESDLIKKRIANMAVFQMAALKAEPALMDKPDDLSKRVNELVTQAYPDTKQVALLLNAVDAAVEATEKDEKPEAKTA